MRSIIAAAAVAALCVGCTPQQQELVDTMEPAVVSVADVFFPGIAPVLTGLAALACTVQADANALPSSSVATKISTEAGTACTW